MFCLFMFLEENNANIIFTGLGFPCPPILLQTTHSGYCPLTGNPINNCVQKIEKIEYYVIDALKKYRILDKKKMERFG